ncbi:hypothetical protein TNCT_573971 [Trichonephila clavata]|uniref:Uncharacterized protein n=1 Tax=Trichonephila clavata TaxID=2740835 RepID=A0A8X6LDI4_TRICU|nr:hypothetical protein TNCT_573971 [Trichonephila clavata]
MRKTCYHLVPYCLSDDKNQVRLEASHDFFETADATPNFLSCIVKEDESWCLMYSSERKQESMESRALKFPRLKNVRAEK